MTSPTRSGDLPRQAGFHGGDPRVERRDFGPHLGKSGLELVGGDVVALLDALADGLSDDFGLVAVDAAAGELVRRLPR